ncbi:MAG: DUF2723 domain-containing protein [Bacteroidetes bacterium]|nr:DUF2723 domain-containing protein [Bacteroidota bacterium]
MKNNQLKYPLLIFGVLQTIYILTLCPTIYIGDSSEFIANISLLGISHPPGFPFYSLLNRVLITFLKFLNYTIIINYTSALFSSLTGVVLYLILSQLNIKKIIAITSALIFGVSLTLWSRSTIAEIYTIATFSVALISLIMLQYFIKKDNRLIFLIFYLAGLLLSQHILSVIAFFPVLLFLILANPKFIFHPKALFLGITFFILGFSIYYYIIARSQTNPPSFFALSETFSELYRFLTPRVSIDLIGHSTSKIGTNSAVNLTWFIENTFLKEFWVFGVFALIGLFNSKVNIKIRAYFIITISLIVTYAVRSPLMLHSDLDAQYIVAYFFWSLLIGLGIDLIWQKISAVTKTKYQKLVVSVGAILLLLIPIGIFANNFKMNDKSNNVIAEALWIDTFANLPTNSIVFCTADDDAFIPFYYQNIKHEREDLTVISVPTLKNKSFVQKYLSKLNLTAGVIPFEDAFIEFVIDELKSQREFFFTFRSKKTPISIDENRLEPYGFIWRLKSEHTGDDIDGEMLSDLRMASVTNNTLLDARASLIVYEKYLIPLIKNAYKYEQSNNYDLAISCMNACLEINYPLDKLNLGDAYFIRGAAAMKKGDSDNATTDFKKAIELNKNDWRAYEYLGNIFESKQEIESALSLWKIAIQINPSRSHLAKKIAFYRTNSKNN